MSAPEDYVCDLRPLMRVRLLCGLYSRRAVPPRWRRLAQAYCLALGVAMAAVIYSRMTPAKSLSSTVFLTAFAQFFVAQVISLWTGDEYIYTFFTQNKLTDVTLDSAIIFNRLQKQLTEALIYIPIYLPIFSGLFCWSFFSNQGEVISVAIAAVAATLLELFDACSYVAKFLVMSLLNARLLVLKRRLQRYGFRAVGRATPQPYCQIYLEILQMLDATENPLKVLLFFDLIFSCMKLTGMCLVLLYEFKWNVFTTVPTILYLAVFLPHTLFVSFGHVSLLESAAVHCHDMELFTVTQLIKAPTDSERRRMREFLRALEQRGARYYVLRALPLNARLVLRALGFCMAQVIVFATTILN